MVAGLWEFDTACTIQCQSFKKKFQKLTKSLVGFWFLHLAYLVASMQVRVLEMVGECSANKQSSTLGHQANQGPHIRLTIEALIRVSQGCTIKSRWNFRSEAVKSAWSAKNQYVSDNLRSSGTVVVMLLNICEIDILWYTVWILFNRTHAKGNILKSILNKKFRFLVWYLSPR